MGDEPSFDSVERSNNKGHRLSPFVLVTSALGLLVACPIVTWWLVGDLSFASSQGGRGDDYIVKPPAISQNLERALGVPAAIVLVVSFLLLVSATRRRSMRPGWWVVLGLLLSVGVVLGAGERVVTAGVVGANIGGGLVILFGTPICLVAIIIALVMAVVLMRRSAKNANKSG